MNARDRIAQVLADTEKEGATDTANSADDEYRILANAVLMVLPGLLTDPQVVTAAAEATDTAHVRTGRILAAAAKALTGGAP